MLLLGLEELNDLALLLDGGLQPDEVVLGRVALLLHLLGRLFSHHCCLALALLGGFQARRQSLSGIACTLTIKIQQYMPIIQLHDNTDSVHNNDQSTPI